ADNERDAGGLGGAPLVYLPSERLVFGGGGGAGEGNNNQGTSGGAGGGVMIFRAQEVRGPGTFNANGATPPPTTGDDGAGGGGAGGAISLRASQEVECGLLEAKGGAGGNVTEPSFVLGPGGGGGGGVIFLQGETFACTTLVLAGAAGQSAATGTSHGAGPSDIGSGPAYGSDQRLQQRFRLPNTPTLTQPAHGATGVARRPRIEGTAERNVRVHLLLDGQPLAMVTSDSTGAYGYSVPSDLASGEHALTASAEVLGVRSPPSAASRFTVVSSGEGESRDAGTPDSGTPDAAVPDAGMPDGGSEEPLPDAGGQGPGVQEPPVVVVPSEGEAVGPLPLLAGTANGADQVGLEVDGQELIRVEVDAEGRFRYALTEAQALAPGVHRVIARTYEASGAVRASSPSISFEVVMPGEVGCGCGTSSGAGLGAVALLLAAWASRRRSVH
ncbi:MAG TPA: MYXO-CTERM sorting domain-containing protein, partial [Myxococcaceae bacterium]